MSKEFPYEQSVEFSQIAREHNERMTKERLGTQDKPFDHTEGKQIAKGVYQVGGMIYVGDKL